MPRVSIKKEKYKLIDFTQKVKGRCAERGVSQSELAEVLGISQPALSQKMKSGAYSLEDFIKIRNYLKFTMEELEKII